MVCVACVHAERVRWGDGQGNAPMVDGDVWLQGSEYMGGTRGSGFVSTANDVLEMSVVLGVRGICGLCEMCMCLARGGSG